MNSLFRGLKNILSTVLVFVSGIQVHAFDRKDILPTTVKGETGSGSIGDVSFTGTTSTLDTFLSFVRESIFGLLALVAIGMFLYVGFSLIKAQGNPEELKKAFVTLIHIIIGMFIIAISWAVITIVSGLNF